MSTPARRTNHRGPRPPALATFAAPRHPHPPPPLLPEPPRPCASPSSPPSTSCAPRRTATPSPPASSRPAPSSKSRSPHLGRTRVAECLVGDHTGTILVTARNDQVDLLKPDTTVIFRNAKIDMFKGTMRLSVDKWGRIEVTEAADFKVKEDNNMSLVEYELVDVAEEED